MQFEPLQLVAGAFLGFLSAGGLRWWQYRRDMLIGRIERFYATLQDAADTATEHWLSEKPAPVEVDKVGCDAYRAAAKERAAVELLEARILGLQMRLDGLLTSFQERLSEHDASSIKSKMNELSVALGGGEFLASERRQDPHRARMAQSVASDLIVLVAAGLDRAMTFKGYWTFVGERAIRRQKRAIGENC